jgi:phosphopentomutase
MSIGRSGGENRFAFEDDPSLAALLRDGEGAGPSPGEEDFRRDANTGNIACSYLESHRPSFLFVSLGETDEYAHQGDYHGYLAALHEADAIVGRLAAQVASLTAAGHPSTLMVTTDHGRSSGFATHGGDSPESARVWLVATGAGILARGATSSTAPRHLSDVSQTLRRVLGLPRVQAAPAGHVLTELFVAPDTALAAQ